ncbi:hypothetical protein [Sphaerisporangium sp. TRM90804]|uniref:hypothetical protein n=1 Tax=Sphaerisporangium sp. TRM90804 TaxID=3031113 RepID=UPI0024475F4A|nr:hypothetical protein [Sphaerisporangium sp. TRM90804]MDH2426400.1 hypothetical protein [Sphaerisporangium sp. TRM90804]
MALCPVFAALLLISCGEGGRIADPPGGDEPRRGGVSRLAGNGDIDHLDTAAAYYTVS